MQASEREAARRADGSTCDLAGRAVRVDSILLGGASAVAHNRVHFISFCAFRDLRDVIREASSLHVEDCGPHKGRSLVGRSLSCSLSFTHTRVYGRTIAARRLSHTVAGAPHSMPKEASISSAVSRAVNDAVALQPSESDDLIGLVALMLRQQQQPRISSSEYYSKHKDTLAAAIHIAVKEAASRKEPGHRTSELMELMAESLSRQAQAQRQQRCSASMQPVPHNRPAETPEARTAANDGALSSGRTDSTPEIVLRPDSPPSEE